MQKPTSAINIRKASKNDADQILSFIKDLALYEKEPESAELCVDDILRDGFGESQLFHCLIGEVDGEAVGFSIYFFTWSTWKGRASLYLEDLFVPKKFRGKGYGKAFLKHLAQIAIEKKCERFEWSVLDWNNLARDFYHSLGARHQEGWLPYRLEGKALKSLAGF